MAEQTLTGNDNSADTLDAGLADQIRDLCQQGYALYDQRDFSGAVRQFFSAWTLLPKPQTHWREAGWVLTALGDAYFAKGNYESGKEALLSALHCPGTRDNPIVHLRLGQCLLELNEPNDARKHLEFALQQGGSQLYAKEDDKYLDALQTS